MDIEGMVVSLARSRRIPNIALEALVDIYRLAPETEARRRRGVRFGIQFFGPKTVRQGAAYRHERVRVSCARLSPR